MRACFHEDVDNFEVLQCDPRLDDEDGQLVEWYIERYRVGHQLEFPFVVGERFLLFEEGTEIRSVALENVEKFPGARVLRYTFAGRPGSYAQTWVGGATRGLAMDGRIGGTKYLHVFMQLIERHAAGEELKFPLVLRALNWAEVDMIEPENISR
jgi:hypothetical protein